MFSKLIVNKLFVDIRVLSARCFERLRVLYCRGLVSAGATGACIPAEILQWVRRTRPEENLVVLIMIFYGENPKLGKFACCLHQKHKCMNNEDSKQILKHGKFNSYQFFGGRHDID